MIVAIHQPQYLPWLGYFDKIDQADVFCFLDDVQYKKNEYQNRNRIKTPQGWQWLTVPCALPLSVENRRGDDQKRRQMGTEAFAGDLHQLRQGSFFQAIRRPFRRNVRQAMDRFGRAEYRVRQTPLRGVGNGECPHGAFLGDGLDAGADPKARRYLPSARRRYVPGGRGRRRLHGCGDVRGQRHSPRFPVFPTPGVFPAVRPLRTLHVGRGLAHELWTGQHVGGPGSATEKHWRPGGKRDEIYRLKRIGEERFAQQNEDSGGRRAPGRHRVRLRGSLIKYADRGHDVFLLVMSNGEHGGDGTIRMAEQEKAAEIMHAKELFWGD